MYRDRKRKREIRNQWIKWQRSLNKELEHTQYRVVYLPPIDLMPYEDAKEVTRLEDRVCRLQESMEEFEAEDDDPHTELMPLDGSDEANIVSKALAIYKTVLLTIHGERLREEMRAKGEAGGWK